MTRYPRTLLLALLVATVPVLAVGLPDTGQDTCYNDTVADSRPAAATDSIARDTGTHPRQDCRYGRDVAYPIGALTKTSAGAKGFDYSKVTNLGIATADPNVPLGTAYTAWGCTLDNITGLMWEVKTATNTDLRYSGHTYRWYSTDGSTNGGSVGSPGTNTCNATLPGNLCNTQAFVAAVNAAYLCLYTDWRMPTLRELLTLVDADGSIPSIAPTYFPNTIASYFWSGSSYMPGPSSAWSVDFYDGSSVVGDKLLVYRVRLVRGGQF